MKKISFEEKVNVISVLGRVMDRKNLVEKIRGREKAKDLQTIENALRFYLRNTEVQGNKVEMPKGISFFYVGQR